MTLEQLLSDGAGKLQQQGVPEAELNAWYLLQSCYENVEKKRLRRSDYFLQKEETVFCDMQEKYEISLEQRKKRIPLEHITGTTEFMGLTFRVNEHVLIPRQDTETLVECILPYCKGKRVLDMCTGSGCIGISICAYGKPEFVTLSDVSEKACEKARENLVLAQEQEPSCKACEVDVVCGDLWEKITGTYDVIVSNPPYIESGVIPTLMPEVKDFEPMNALDGGADGMIFYRNIVKEAHQYLVSGGMLAFEIGYNQGKLVADLMKENHFFDVKIEKDLAGNDRVVMGRMEELDV